jgi:hypothetical protein
MRQLLLLLFATSTAGVSYAQERLIPLDGNCFIVYSLSTAYTQQLDAQASKLGTQISRQNYKLIDLNNWGHVTYNHIELSGRQRNTLRNHFHLPKHKNQILVLDRSYRILTKYTDQIGLVNALLDCKS